MKFDPCGGEKAELRQKIKALEDYQARKIVKRQILISAIGFLLIAVVIFITEIHLVSLWKVFLFGLACSLFGSGITMLIFLPKIKSLREEIEKMKRDQRILG